MPETRLQRHIRTLGEELDQKRDERDSLPRWDGAETEENIIKRQRLTASIDQLGKELHLLRAREEIQEFLRNNILDYFYTLRSSWKKDGTKETVSEVITFLITAFAELKEKLEPELAKHSKLAAQSHFRDFKNLTEAGFTQEQAMSILLTKIKPSSLVHQLQEVMAGAKEANSLRR